MYTLLATVPVGGVVDTSSVETGDWVLLFAYVGGALFISFTCSLLEAVVMSVDKFKLKAQASDGDAGAARMLEIKDRTEDAIAAILTLNTIAHTVGATLAGAKAMKIFGSEGMGIFSGVLTFLILVLTEIIPKNAGERNAERYSGLCSWILKIIIPLMYPLVKANSWLVHFLYGEKDERIDLATVAAVNDQAQEDGLIDEHQRRKLERVISVSEKTVQDLMTVRADMVTVSSDMSLLDLSKEGEHTKYSRVVVEDSNGQIPGYVYYEEAFRSVVLGVNGADTTLKSAKGVLGDAEEQKQLLRPLGACTKDSSAKELFQSMLKHRQQLVLVSDAETVVGLVTLEDFLEHFIDSDIQDEDDPISGGLDQSNLND